MSYDTCYAKGKLMGYGNSSEGHLIQIANPAVKREEGKNAPVSWRTSGHLPAEKGFPEGETNMSPSMQTRDRVVWTASSLFCHEPRVWGD